MDRALGALGALGAGMTAGCPGMSLLHRPDLFFIGLSSPLSENGDGGK